MRKLVKISWVFWLHIETYRTNYYRKVRCANSFEFVMFGIRVSVGMPWAATFVKYHITNAYGKQVEGIEKDNEAMMAAPGLKIRMPKRKYSFDL